MDKLKFKEVFVGASATNTTPTTKENTTGHRHRDGTGCNDDGSGPHQHCQR